MLIGLLVTGTIVIGAAMDWGSTLMIAWRADADFRSAVVGGSIFVGALAVVMFAVILNERAASKR
ncbi:hypothetical protein [Burkholderia multivorans]|nr:hypothetical protein [Burkholderia multivorans]